MNTQSSHTVSETENGNRLDAFVAQSCGCGIRTAKRRITEGAVHVDGKIRPAQYKLRTGNVVAVCRETPPAALHPLTVAGTHGDFLAFVKPAGLHTAHLAGSAEPSLEQMIAAQWENNSTVPQLLSRLDAMTSGLVLAAFSDTAAVTFRQMETAGQVSKYYLTVIDGILDETVIVTNALETANRTRTRVLPQADPDRARHTTISPLGVAAAFSIPGTNHEMTFAAVCIKRGARHQIRAHLAHLGFPVVGDALYGQGAEGETFRLHHTRLIVPECEFFCLPSWLPSSIETSHRKIKSCLTFD